VAFGDEQHDNAVMPPNSPLSDNVMALTTEQQRRLALADLSLAWVHEIKNAIGVIEGRGYLAESAQSWTQCRAQVEQMRAETKRLIDMLGDWLELARPRQLELTSLDMNHVAERALALCETHARLRGVRVSINFIPQPLTISGSEQHLVQVVLNLLLNAAAANSQTGADALLVSTGIEQGQALMSVIDSGPGLNKPYRGTTAFESGSSTGLGLFMVEHILSQHRGSLTLSNHYNAAGTVAGAVASAQLPLLKI
jgi:signal transduction histidine kinase